MQDFVQFLMDQCNFISILMCVYLKIKVVKMHFKDKVKIYQFSFKTKSNTDF